MGSATYRSLLPDMWRTFISCFFSGPFRTRNLGMPIRSEIKLCFVVGMCWKDFHINFQCMPTLPSWVQRACSVIVQGGRVVKVLDFTTQYHQYRRRNIESSQERNPAVAVVVIQGGRLVMVLDFSTVSTQFQHWEAVQTLSVWDAIWDVRTRQQLHYYLRWVLRWHRQEGQRLQL